jgi:hypothetical protein
LKDAEIVISFTFAFSSPVWFVQKASRDGEQWWINTDIFWDGFASAMSLHRSVNAHLMAMASLKKSFCHGTKDVRQWAKPGNSLIFLHATVSSRQPHRTVKWPAAVSNIVAGWT